MFSLFIPIFYTMLQLIILVGAGYLLKIQGSWSKEFFTSLSRMVVRIFLPLYLFVKIVKTNQEDLKTSFIFPIAAVLIIGIGMFLSLLLIKLFRIKGPEKKAALALGSFGNSGYLPLTLTEIFPLTMPMLFERFGQETPNLYVGAYLLAYSPILWSVGNYLMTGKTRRPKINELLTPPLIGVLCGFCIILFNLQPLLFNQRLPFFHIYGALNRLGQLTLPLVLISLGSMIANLGTNKNIIQDKKSVYRVALVSALVHFLALPAVFYLCYFLLFRRIHLSAVIIWVLFLETQVPPATNLSLMAAQARIHENEAAFTLLFTYLLYLIIFPIHLLIFLSLPGILSG